MSVADTIKEFAAKLRYDSMISTSEAGSGHPTSCMSAAELVATLFATKIRLDGENPYNRSADCFLISKGHAAPLLYSATITAGLADADIKSLRKSTSILEGHPTPRYRWSRVATGSLGQGLSVACGIAHSRKLDKLNSNVYCLLGDGEVAEGSVWEAFAFAGFYKLSNLVAIIDVNGLGQSGRTMLVHDIETLAARVESFGWKVVKVADGNDIAKVQAAFEAVPDGEKPSCIIAATKKGKGVSFLEGKDGWHGKPLKKGEQLDNAMREIGGNPKNFRIQTQKPGGNSPADFTTRTYSITTTYKLGDQVATREAYGAALAKLGKIEPRVVALDGDVKNSTFSEVFKFAIEERFVECFIAEQNMLGAALGFATEGKIPFASTFAAFLSRAYDFVRMASYSRPWRLIVCGSHAGVSIGEDGPSQMGLEDIAMFRTIINSTVLYPSDAVCAEKLVARAAENAGITYIRTNRPKTPVIYDNNKEFHVGGAELHRPAGIPVATIIGAGVTFHEALKAQKILATKSIPVSVVDLYSVKPIDENLVTYAIKETGNALIVEDHYKAGGIGEAIMSLGIRGRYIHRAVDDIPYSAKPEELLARFKISADEIVKTVENEFRK